MNELTVIHGDQRVVLQPGQAAYIGRRENSALVVSDKRVSREHIRLSWGPQGWALENVGRSGTFVSGQPVTQLMLGQAVEARLAAPDGPVVRFEPAPAGAPAGAPPAAAQPVPAQPVPAQPVPAQPVAGQPVPPAVRAGQPADAHGGQVISALRTLIPVAAWLRDPAMRKWQRLLVIVYALVPLILLIVLQHTANLVTLGWVYCLYVAPLWAIVFWYLIRPGPLTRLHLVITAIIIVAELLLIPALTLPWESALAPANASHNLLAWMAGVGLPEELTKALPVMVLAIVLLKFRKTKLDVRMWMYLAAISGLFFGAYEASQVYVPAAIVDIARGSAFGIPLFAERVFVDGLQHALWAGIAGFFIGLGTNYGRQRIALWFLGIAVPTVLHGLNDGVLSWPSAQAEWIWILIQAFSLFLFLGYTASAARIEQQVRHTPIFRGESVYLDPSRLVPPPGS
jgi:RsiW-degrading membrane proteinase PrsW (M82 family)